MPLRTIDEYGVQCWLADNNPHFFYGHIMPAIRPGGAAHKRSSGCDSPGRLSVPMNTSATVRSPLWSWQRIHCRKTCPPSTLWPTRQSACPDSGSSASGRRFHGGRGPVHVPSPPRRSTNVLMRVLLVRSSRLASVSRFWMLPPVALSMSSEAVERVVCRRM